MTTKPCSAKDPSRCRYHGSPQRTINQQAASFAAAGSAQPAPIILPTNPLSFSDLDGVDASYVDYEYDDYGCAGKCDNDDMCRCAEYTGLRVSSTVDVKLVLSGFFNAQSEGELPDGLVNYATSKLKMDTPDIYKISAVYGYYGEEVSIELDSDVAKKLEEWYYSQNNAKDRFGVLEYCRSKGLDTTNKNPVESVKAQLHKENGISLKKLNNVNRAYTKKLQLKKIVPGNPQHLAAAMSRPVEALGKGKAIAGVLLMDKGQYILLDGYHRFNHLSANGKTVGEYIILE
jgi:hypothetical protein